MGFSRQEILEWVAILFSGEDIYLLHWIYINIWVIINTLRNVRNNSDSSSSSRQRKLVVKIMGFQILAQPCMRVWTQELTLHFLGDFLGGQWPRPHTPNAGDPVQSLVGELRPYVPRLRTPMLEIDPAQLEHTHTLTHTQTHTTVPQSRTPRLQIRPGTAGTHTYTHTHNCASTKNSHAAKKTQHS